MTVKGGCLCGAVTYEIAGEIPPADACHCTMCRKSSGHFVVSADVRRDALTVTRDDGLRWYQSSPKVRRGFCRICGSSLFFDPPADRTWIAVEMGTMDAPTGAHIYKHIFVADKGDYYEITDGLPQEMTPP